jgi:hypothetical protein
LAHAAATNPRRGSFSRAKKVAAGQTAAPDIVIGGAACRGEGNDCGAAANGVNLIASANSARLLAILRIAVRVHEKKA